MRCANCGADNREGRKFCTQCGSALPAKCPRCGAAIEPAEKFCGECGAVLGTPPAATGKSDEPQIRIAGTPAPENLEGERKTVTALFADIKGSMELIEDLDPEEARAIVDPAIKLMMAAVQRYGGYVAQSTGDGIFALFGAPVAHEDHPQRALYAAVRMQEELKRYSDRIRSEGRLPIQARVGVNTGEVVVRSITTGEGRTEYVPVGHATGIAARMQALAPVGSIAATEVVRKLCEGYFVFKSLGPTKVKGVSEPVNVYEVTGLGPLRTRFQRAAIRGYTKFIGRQREMQALSHAVELVQGGRGQVVATVAEPGVGKSRLLFEFKVRNRSGWMVLEAVSVSHGKASPYLPVLDLLLLYFGIESGDDPRKRREKVIGKVLGLDRTLEDSLPYLFGLLGLTQGDDPLAAMDAPIRRRRTLEALRRMLLRESLNQPLMIIFEDLHWIDEETQAFLNLLTDSIATAKILLLVNYRPEYSHQWSNKTYYTQLRLDPLGLESSDEMLDALLGVSSQVPNRELVPLKRLIIDKTAGTPLFMEEIVQALFEERALVRNGEVKLMRPLDAVKIPPTVQAILASRIDGLRVDQKDLLQSVAAIGMEFSFDLLATVVAKPTPELERILSELQLAEFVYEQPAAGDLQYTFKHALTHDVAYDSLLQERRRLLHSQIGIAIESLYADRLNDHLAQLAFHFTRGGPASKATHYLLLASEEAIGHWAYDQAAEGLRTALTLLDRMPDPEERLQREAAIQTALARALSVQGPTSPGIQKALLRARELCIQCGDERRLYQVLHGLRIAYNFNGELGRALELGMEVLAIGERSGDSGRLFSARAALGQTLYFRGELAAARRHCQAAVEMQRAGALYPDIDFPVRESRLRLALVECVSGYPARALQLTAEAESSARKAGDPMGVVLYYLLSSAIFCHLRDLQKVREHAETGLRLANDVGRVQEAGYLLGHRGWHLAMTDNPSEGIAVVRQSLEVLNSVGALTHTHVKYQLAECYLRAGQPDSALQTLADALSYAQKSGELYMTAELNRLTGETLLARHPPQEADAEISLRAAIQIARAQQAKLWEVRATTSLARLLQGQDKRAEARAMLAEIYNWFTEGFDTADLKDAKALLQELSGSP